jgi:hypothetical protein
MKQKILYTTEITDKDFLEKWLTLFLENWLSKNLDFYAYEIEAVYKKDYSKINNNGISPVDYIEIQHLNLISKDTFKTTSIAILPYECDIKVVRNIIKNL